MVRRVEVLAALGAAAAAAAVPRAAAAQTTPLRIGAIPIDADGEAYYALDAGIFAKHGLAVQIQPFHSGVAAVAALMGGSVDVCISDIVGTASAYSRGLPITLLAPCVIFDKNSQVSSLLVSATSSIHGPKDLNGKSVATNGLKNIVQIPTEAWIDNNGGDAKTVRFLELPVPAMPAAVESGRVDAAVIAEPFITNAQKTGKFRVIPLTENNVAPVFLYAGWAAQKAWAAKNPETVKRFVAAMAEAATWSNANRPKTAEMLAKLSGVPPAVTSTMGRVTYAERFNLAIIQPVIDASAKYGAIPKAFPARDLISTMALAPSR